MEYEIENFYCEVGAGRSGTNFLGQVLRSHPMLAYWRRPKYVWRHGNAWKPDDCLMADDATPRIKRYIHRRFHEFMTAQGKDHLLVCLQAMALGLEFVYEVFPDAKVIHIIRDGRDVAKSQTYHWMRHLGQETSRMLQNRGREVPLTDYPAYVGEFLGEMWYKLSRKNRRYAWGPRIKDWKRLSREMDILQYCALCWKECVGEARRVGLPKAPQQYYEIRFEDLVERPEQSVPALLDYMGLPMAAEVKRFIDEHIDRSRPRQYQRKMSDEELQRIRPYVEPLLKKLGYIETYDEPPSPPAEKSGPQCSPGTP